MIRRTCTRKKLGTWILAILLMVGMVLSLCRSDSFAARDNFKVEVSSEISNDGGYYKVSMNIENLGKDFKGKARLVAEGSSGMVGYDVDISIPNGSTKTYTVNVPEYYKSTTSAVEVQIFNQKDKKEYAEKFSSVFSQGSDTLRFAVLSDNADSLSKLDMAGNGVSVNSDIYYIATENVDGSKLAEDIDSYSGLIINDYDTSTLSDETLSKIEDWTRQGGILVLGSGENAERVDSGFSEDFLGMKFSSTYTLSYTSNVEEFDEYEVARFTYSADYSYDSFMSYSCVVGNGLIVCCTIDLADYRDNDGSMSGALQSLYQNAILNVRTTTQNYGYSNISLYTLETQQGFMEKPAKSASVLLILLIILYTAIVGPISYLVLMAMKKREMIWIAIPAISLITVLFVFLISLGVRVKGISLKSVSAIDLSNGKKDCYVFGYAPDPSEWSVKAKEPCDYVAITDSYSYGNGVELAVKQSEDEEELIFYPDGSFDTKCAVLCSKESGYGNFNVDVYDSGAGNQDDDDDDYYSNSYNSGVDSGTVENTTGIDFDYVLIITQAGTQLKENVKNGDKITISLDKSSYKYSHYSFGMDYLNNDYSKKYYDKKDYAASGAISAMILASQKVESQNLEMLVLGVKESKSKTDQGENSWDVYYSAY